MLNEPNSLEELTDAVAEAALAREPIEILGDGALRPIGRPVAAPRQLSTRRLDRIHFYEPDELVISLEAGVGLDQIEATLAGSGQQLAFEPPDLSRLLGSSGRRTIGGAVAANLSGPRRLQAGALRDHLLGFVAVNGRGEAIKSGGRVVKNVTGYDLSKLVAGSWGTLCVLSSVTLKVLPRAETSATLLVPGASAEAAVRLFARALAAPLDVTGAAWLPAELARPFADGPVAALRLEGFARSVSERLDSLANLADGAPTHELNAQDTASLWRDIRDAEPLALPADKAIWRVSVPPTAGPGVLTALEGAVGYLDWAGGLVWLAIEASGDAGAARLRAAMAPSGGHATLIRAPADLRANLPVFEPLQPALAALTDRVKEAFDPLRLFNPGRIHAGL